jgi:hypothetical protein
MIVPNKYAGACQKCGAHVRAKAGQLIKTDGKFGVLCSLHQDPAHELPAFTPRQNHYKRAHSGYIRFSSGAVMYQNPNGRCIDAPCCGCCS